MLGWNPFLSISVYILRVHSSQISKETEAFYLFRIVNGTINGSEFLGGVIFFVSSYNILNRSVKRFRIFECAFLTFDLDSIVLQNTHRMCNDIFVMYSFIKL